MSTAENRVATVPASIYRKGLVLGKVAEIPIFLRPLLVKPSAILQYFFHAVSLDADVNFSREVPTKEPPKRYHVQFY